MKEFHAKHKHHIRLWLILAVVTIASGIIAYSDRENSNPVIEPKNTDIVYTTVDKSPQATAPLAENNHDALIQTTGAINTPENVEGQNSIPVTLTIEETPYALKLIPGKTVYDLMQVAKEQKLIQFSTRDYGGDLGQLIEEINGIKNSVRDKKYWIYYINGEKATIGVSNYRPQTHDIITWKYEDETI